MENCKNITTEDAFLWLVNFKIKGGGKGTAVIKAKSPNNASMLLKNNGMYNGIPGAYIIEQIEQIISSPDEMLISEQILTKEEV